MTLLFSILAVFFGSVLAQDYFDERNVQRYHTYTHLQDIPKTFQVNGENSEKDIVNYIRDINNIAKNQHFNIVYSVNVKKTDQKTLPKKAMPKMKSKKYNFALKLSNLKLSNYEKLRKKISEEKENLKKVEEVKAVTKKQHFEIYSSKAPFIGKYRAFANKPKMKYAKKIKPVKNNVIILE